jgi:hypothetical protein
VQTTAIGGRGPSQVDGYDRLGHLTARSVAHGAVFSVGVPAGGFAIVTQ